MLRKVIAGFVFLLAVGICAGLIWFNFFRERMVTQFFATMQRPPQVISATPVVAKAWTPGISAIGTARAEFGVELAVEIGGVVRDIRFQANDHVKKGDVVVQLDDSVERADLIDAQAAVKLAESTLERSTTLRQRGFDTQSAYDQAVAGLATARSRLQRIQAILDQKALNAPFDGVIGIPRINPGQYVQPGTVVATLQDLDRMKVDFTVPEQAAAQVKAGQTVRFGSGSGDLPFTGKVSGIDPRVDPQTRLVPVQAMVDGTHGGGIVPGQFLQVRVELPVEQNIVTVPQTAVVTSLYGDYVYVVEDSTKDGKTQQIARQVFVKVGRREGRQSEILSGVQPGQTVVTAGQNKIQAGAPVKIDNSIDITQQAATEG